jgi:hypothetical protein
MSPRPTLPSTLPGLKRLAKHRKREHGLTHQQALDRVARELGYENYIHAQRQLPAAAPRSGTRRSTYLTAYWRSPEHGQEGRETLRIELNRSLPDLITPYRLQFARGLGGFKIDALDHLEARLDWETPDQARTEVCRAARYLMLMDATGLEPATSRQHDRGLNLSKCPGFDHPTRWVDQTSGEYIASIEPYRDGAAYLRALEAYFAENQRRVVCVPAPSPYLPGSSTLYLIGQSPDVLERLALDAMGMRAAPTPEQWTGESAPYYPNYVSPARVAAGRRKRSRPPVPVPGEIRNGATPCTTEPMSQYALWRPAASLALITHRKIGHLISTVMCSGYLTRAGATRLGQACGELEQWLYHEHGAIEINGEYPYSPYGAAENSAGPHRTQTRLRRQDVAKTMEQVRTLLLDYPDCPPRRRMRKAMATATKNLRTRPERGMDHEHHGYQADASTAH